MVVGQNDTKRGVKVEFTLRRVYFTLERTKTGKMNAYSFVDILYNDPMINREVLPRGNPCRVADRRLIW